MATNSRSKDSFDIPERVTERATISGSAGRRSSDLTPTASPKARGNIDNDRRASTAIARHLSKLPSWKLPRAGVDVFANLTETNKWTTL
eukprot:scaffold364928_cov45-Prasinocladus_malaysianus.AAC.1